MSLKRFAVALVLGCLALPAVAGEQIYLFRTLEDPAVTPDCAPGDTVLLGASLYAPRTRASDALVMKDPGVSVGTAVGCGKLLTYTPFDTRVQSPFSMRFVMADRTITAKGTCTITSLTFPVPGVPAPLLLVGCTLRVDANPELGIVNGIAVSTSVFTPVPLPGFGTGSFWTLQVYTQD